MPIPSEGPWLMTYIVKPKENILSKNALVPFTPNFNDTEDLWDNDFDLLAAIAETQKAESNQRKNTTTTVSKQIVKKFSLTIPMMFNNCKIEGNITINLTKWAT